MTTTAAVVGRALEHDLDVGERPGAARPPRPAGRRGRGRRRAPGASRWPSTTRSATTASVPGRGPGVDVDAVVAHRRARRRARSRRRRPARWPRGRTSTRRCPTSSTSAPAWATVLQPCQRRSRRDEERHGDERERADGAAVELAAHRGRPVAGHVGEHGQQRPGEHDDGGRGDAARPSPVAGRAGRRRRRRRSAGRAGTTATADAGERSPRRAPASAQPTARCSAKPWIDGVDPGAHEHRRRRRPAAHGAATIAAPPRGAERAGRRGAATSAASHTSSDVFSTGSHAQ